MPNLKSFLVTMAKRSVSGDARDFKNIESQAVISFFFLQGKAPNEIHAILKETLEENAPSYVTHSLNVVIFPPVLHLALDDPKQ